jgi:hypothetical protein
MNFINSLFLKVQPTMNHTRRLSATLDSMITEIENLMSTPIKSSNVMIIDSYILDSELPVIVGGTLHSFQQTLLLRERIMLTQPKQKQIV